ncbi:NAD-P-binding protein [Rhodocollybia butyracea]|uniref:NAD-P-binding protein n=1 Tax=Rhodocollybia butyracea TaxID=206335 RepID=A0A9P5Q0R9_9AGAR|nr:NAD-P-binding protein [Rhodocollybia butyracea]
MRKGFVKAVACENILMAPRFDPKKDLVNLSGRVVIVTGANRESGLGYGTVRHLARAGAKVYIAARNEKQSLASIEKIKAELDGQTHGGKVCFLKLDLSDPRGVKKVAEEFMAKESRLDVLVNNAAIVFVPFEKTSDGVSKIITTNLVGPFVFTLTLLPLLAKTAAQEGSDVRIVNLTSLVHYIAPKIKKLKTLDDLNQEFRRRPLSAFTRYGHTKVLIILWTKALHTYLNSPSTSSALPGTERITAMALDPGSVDTFSVRWPLPWLWRPFVRLVMTAPNLEVGTHPMAFAAAGKKIRDGKEAYGGRFLNERFKIAKPSRNARSEKISADLWTLLEKIKKDMGL